MATVDVCLATGEAHTRVDTQYDTNSDASATWAAWAEEATSRTFGYWIGEQGGRTSVADDGPTLDHYAPSEPESEEAKLAREEEERKEREEVEKAEHKAKVLLLELIGRGDYKKFCRSGYIDVEGNSGKVYRIKPGAMTKVFAGKDKLDVALESLCIAMKDCCLPEADEAIWKKLMIESDEEAFVKTANHFDY